MKLYYKVKSTGKCGCAKSSWYVTEKYSTKAALKKANSWRTLPEMWTEEQLKEKYGTAAEMIIREAY